MSTELVRQIEIKSSQLRKRLLPILKDRVFHVTSQKGFSRISVEEIIRNNQKSRFSFSFPQSKKNYGRKRGYICLFDLRSLTDQCIEESFQNLYFLNPFSGDNYFLLLKKELYPQLIGWKQAQAECGYREMWIPYVECWHPGDIFLRDIEEILRVVVIDDQDYGSGTFLSMMKDLK